MTHMPDEQEMKLRCYGSTAVGGLAEKERLEAAKELYKWLQETPPASKSDERPE